MTNEDLALRISRAESSLRDAREALRAITLEDVEEAGITRLSSTYYTLGQEAFALQSMLIDLGVDLDVEL